MKTSVITFVIVVLFLVGGTVDSFSQLGPNYDPNSIENTKESLCDRIIDNLDHNSESEYIEKLEKWDKCVGENQNILFCGSYLSPNKLETNLIESVSVFFSCVYDSVVEIIFPSAYALKENGIIEMPFTETPPAIDGRWTTENEWKDASQTFVSNDGHEMVILVMHDRDFVYVMGDVITDDFSVNVIENVSNYMRFCIDTKNTGGNKMTSKEYCFFQNDVWWNYGESSGKYSDKTVGKGDPEHGTDSGIRFISEPNGYKANSSFSSRNDPFESTNDHRIYEFRVPLSFLGQSNIYGAVSWTGLWIGLNIDNDKNSSQYSWNYIYSIQYPEDSDISIPSTYGSIIAPENTITVPPIPVIKLSVDSLDFGNVQISEKSGEKSITISNLGTGLLKIDDIAMPYGFSISDITTPLEIEPEQSVSFDVIFAPIFVESYTDSLTIVSNDLNKRKLFLSHLVR